MPRGREQAWSPGHPPWGGAEQGLVLAQEPGAEGLYRIIGAPVAGKIHRHLGDDRARAAGSVCHYNPLHCIPLRIDNAFVGLRKFRGPKNARHSEE